METMCSWQQPRPKPTGKEISTMLAKLIGFRMNYTREEIATSKKAVLTQWDEEIPANKKYKTRQK